MSCLLRFRVHTDARDRAPSTGSAYLLANDAVAIRGAIEFDRDGGEIVVTHREQGSAALVLRQPVGELGELTLSTTCLPEREAPYSLPLELARHRLMLCLAKVEEWALMDTGADHPAMRRLSKARELFIESLCHVGRDSDRADELAQRCLEMAIDGSEELALLHGERTLGSRRGGDKFPRYPLGQAVRLGRSPDTLTPAASAALDAADYVALSTPWRELVPHEGDYQWSALDAWVQWSLARRKPLLLGPLLSFEHDQLPEWAYIFEHEYETLRDVIYEHVEAVARRYARRVKSWVVASGLHVNQHITLTYDQIMDLTRMVVLQIKKIDPEASAIVELLQPWGEYYATNPRSIPPITYAELLNEASLGFDGFSLRAVLQAPLPGQQARDLMQLSQLLDRFGALGQPLYVTVGCPSEPITEAMIADAASDRPIDPACGHWRRPPSPGVQGHWLEAALQVALGKSCVDGVTWMELEDHPAMSVPLTGLVDEDGKGKEAMGRFMDFVKRLRQKPTAGLADVSVTGDDDVEIIVD